MECIYSEITNLETDPESPAQWAYSKSTCVFDESENPRASVQSISTPANFYIQKTLTYGELLIVIFLSIFAIAVICKWIGGFVFHRLE